MAWNNVLQSGVALYRCSLPILSACFRIYVYVYELSALSLQTIQLVTRLYGH